ncbi:zinc-binding dehydrogenase [Salmonella enterica subsp. enterica serovar Dublin]|nr:zinc-binding dehydrogenase [Salmonella enterica]MCR4460501.1 zinc-binding dehydrogenase [Salmonella enterica subsp. enterica serovar Dublin]
MGLTTVQALKGVYQVKTVIVVDRIEERLAMAKQSGADWTLNNGQHSLAEFLQQKALKPTLIVDAACHPAILQEAITLASPFRCHRRGRRQRQSRPDRRTGIRRSGDQLRALLPLFSR